MRQPICEEQRLGDMPKGTSGSTRMRATIAHTSGRMLQAALGTQFSLKVSVEHLNTLRAHRDLRHPPAGAEKIGPAPPSEPAWQEGVGSLLLLAAVHETGTSHESRHLTGYITHSLL